MNSSKPTVLASNRSERVVANVRKKFTDIEGRWVGWSDLVRNTAGDVSDWHYHPTSETYVYVIQGSLTIHFGNGGNECVTASVGEFLHIPAGTVHRETTSDVSDLEAFVIRVGSEPEKIAAEQPL